MSLSSVLPRRAVLAVGVSLCVTNLAQAEAATDLDQIVVTASRTAQTQDQTLAPVTVIDRAQIERRQVNSLQDLLRGEAGVSLANNGG
ncbi:TonB-dependent vitamin B12 receptor, partial [Xanthomonas oryzae pv. oryzae]